MRLAVPLAVVSTLLACDPPTEGGGGTSTPTSTRPPIELVVRAVELQMTVTRRGSAGGGEDESWTALEGKMYAVVTAEVAHNRCEDGEKIDTKEASLLLPGNEKAEVVGGGATLEKLCVLCQATEPLNCSDGQAPLRPFTFVFSVAKSVDVSKGQLRYRGKDAELSVVAISDKRGNDALDVQIKEKEQAVAMLRKKLENTGSISEGKIIIGEMDELKRQIDELKKKRR